MTGLYNPIAIGVFLVLFISVTGIGVLASRWRPGDLSDLSEWGLGGRRFGTLITWFLIGGDLYTAYTFIAVPALMFGAGAMGFFAVPLQVFIYPIMFMVLPRLWSVTRKHGYVTAADFVRGRYQDRVLALAVAATGIVATMPYIALQLVGLQVVVGALGLHAEFDIPGFGTFHNLPLFICFLVLAVFTRSSGLRAPALIAIVKDLLIYATVVAAIVVVPAELGGYGKIFDSIDPKSLLLAPGGPGNLGLETGYMTMVIGSAIALFLYPHMLTGVLSSSGGAVIRRNALILPAYAFALGLIALLGYMAVAAHLNTLPEYADGFKSFGGNYAVPALILHSFSPWFVGVAFAAIAIGALVPAAIMAIAAANLFTRNIYKEFVNPNCSTKTETFVAKNAAIAVKLGALVFVLELHPSAAIQLQLLGGIWIIQTLPSVFISLYTRSFHPTALLIGWAAGIIAGTAMAASLNFESSIYPLKLFGLTIPCYPALSAFILNLAVSFILSVGFNATAKSAERPDATSPADYVES